MTLLEMAEEYTEAIVYIKLAIADKQDEIIAAPAKKRDTLRTELYQLRVILRELREIRRVCLTYYTQDRNPRYCYRVGVRK